MSSSIFLLLYTLCVASLAGNTGVRQYVAVQQYSQSVKDKYAID